MNGDGPVGRCASGHEVGKETNTVASSASGEVLDDGLSPTVFGRFAERDLTGWVGRHRSVVTRMSVVLTLVAGLAAALFALRPAAVEPLVSAPVIGVSIEIPPPSPGGGAARPIVATYRVTAADSSTHVAVTGVTGPFIKTSKARAVAGAATGSAATFSVSSVPDCSDVASLATKGPYFVAVTSTSSHGRSVSTRVRVGNSPVDWETAIRQDCWQRTAATGIAIDGLQAAPGRHSRQLVLSVTLHSDIAGDVRVWVVDIADVATLAAADSGTLGAGADHVFRVRWPTAGCSPPALPFSNGRSGARNANDGASPDLAWSVGPVGADPAALFVSPLSPSQLRTICGTVGQAARALP